MLGDLSFTPQVGSMDFMGMDREEFREILEEIRTVRMPFGRFGPKEFPPERVPLMDLPQEYLAWFRGQGFPQGRLGELMEIVADLKDLGMEDVFESMRRIKGGRADVRKKRNRRGQSIDFNEG